MATIDEMIGNVRMRMADPDFHNPSLRHLLRFTLDHVRSLFNQITNSNEAWATGELTQAISPGAEEYSLAITGKPFAMYTTDSSNPSHVERMIPVYTLQNLLLAYEGPRDGAWVWPQYAGGSSHTAMGVAFYQKDGAPGWYARVRPLPQASAQYKILYSIGNWAESAGLSSSPVLTDHHHLIEVRTAMSALPMARWSEDEKANTEKRKELALSLMNDERAFRRDFETYLRSLSQSRIGFRASGYSY